MREDDFTDLENDLEENQYNLSNTKNLEDGFLRFYALAFAQGRVVDETLDKAKEFSNLVNEEDLVLGLGRSPSLFFNLNKIKKNLRIRQIPFSGLPDCLNIISR